MYILGINAGHNATACLLKDGKIIGCVSEERFSRIKNHSGFPTKSVEFLLSNEGITSNKIDQVVLDNNFKKNPYSDTKFLEAYTKKSKKDKFLSWLGYRYPGIFNEYLKKKTPLIKNRKYKNSFGVRKKISDLLKISIDKIMIVDHHVLHALSCCFNLPKDKKTLIFTLDGEGDGLCATINIFDGKKLKTISRTDKSASLGYLYSIATIYLGMKPLQHEFKVMGLAPYAKENNINKIYSKFDKLFVVDDNLAFKSKFNMPFADHFLKKEMRYVRFDILSGAIQKLVEEKTKEWVRKVIKKTGIRDIALAGGVFMNVKANQKISEMDEVNSLYIMPSCGDESNAIGACFWGYNSSSKGLIFPIEHLYLGPEYGNEYIENLIKKETLNEKYNIKFYKDINREIAELLAKGYIVARCSGKSEWGARALGNKSILASPKDSDTVRVLNETIKDRDFWMPFTPSILDSSEKDYIYNPKKIKANFMIITFESTKKAQKDLPAAMHPYDFTLRPQIVKKEHNSDYHEIISQFKKITGIGGVLNTSFNLHGEPNVLTPEDALRTVENSDLKFLVMENFLFEKK